MLDLDLLTFAALVEGVDEEVESFLLRSSGGLDPVLDEAVRQKIEYNQVNRYLS